METELRRLSVADRERIERRDCRWASSRASFVGAVLVSGVHFRSTALGDCIVVLYSTLVLNE
jgi:hypothetical protein